MIFIRNTYLLRKIVDGICLLLQYTSAVQHLFNYDDANISFIAVVHLSCLLVVIWARMLTRILYLIAERSLLLMWTMNQTRAYNLLWDLDDIFQSKRPNDFTACTMYFQNKPLRLDTFNVLVSLTYQLCNFIYDIRGYVCQWTSL